MRKPLCSMLILPACLVCLPSWTPLSGQAGPDTVDVVGDTSRTSQVRVGLAKGNVYRLDADTELDEMEFWLDFSDTQQLSFYVYESPVEFGNYSLMHSQASTLTGTGADWYSSGPVSLNLQAGNYYLIAVSWDGGVRYSYAAGESEKVSFGEQVHGFATGTDPLPASLESLVDDQAIYHQRLTTNSNIPFSLSTTGSCPGAMTFDTTGGSANGPVLYLIAFSMGSFAIPGGQPCAGTVLGLDASVQLVAIAPATGGASSFATVIPPKACGNVFVQALDRPSCAVSNVIGL